MKTPKQLQRYCKGAANHRRIAILQLVASSDGINVDEIAKGLRCNFKTISQHTRALVQSGLLNKQYRGRHVTHSLSPYGKAFLAFLRTF